MRRNKIKTSCLVFAVVDPASNLRILEVASKSMRVSWDASGGDVSGYRVQMIPMMAGSKQQDLYLASTQTSVVVRDLSPDTVYQVNVFTMKDLMSSEPVTVMQKTEPVKVSLGFKEALGVCGFHPECSLGVDVQADVVLLVDGSYSIGVTNFAKVRAFLEVLVNTFDIGLNKVQIALVQYSRDSYTEFYLNTHQDVNAVVKAVRTFPYRGGSTNTGRAMTYVREKIFQTSRGARANVPRVTILITDGKSSDAFKDPATKLRNADVEIFAVGVKDAVRSELEAIANAPAETHVYTVEDFDAFQRISKELTQSICLRIEQEIRSIFQRPGCLTCACLSPELVQPKALTFSDVGSRSFRTSWEIDADNVDFFLVQFKPEEDAEGHYVSMSVSGDTRTTVLPHLTPLTRYEVRVSAQYAKGESLAVSGYETTTEGTHQKTTALYFHLPVDLTGPFVLKRRWILKMFLATEDLEDCDFKLENIWDAGREFHQANKIRSRTNISLKSEHNPEAQKAGPAKNLVTSDVSASSFRASWTAAPGRVQAYKVRWKSLFSGEQGDKTVPGDETSTVLDGLSPETRYQVSVIAAYDHKDSESLTGLETTDGKRLHKLNMDVYQAKYLSLGRSVVFVSPASPAAKSLTVSHETERTMKVTWTPAPGNVLNYRLKYVPMDGGKEVILKLPGTAASTVLKRLQPDTSYNVSVLPVYKRGDGKPRQGVGTTRTLVQDSACSPRDTMLEAFNLTEKTYSSVPGVSMEPGSFNTLCFLSRELHPDGLPDTYTIILMFRLLPDSPAEPFDLWQVSSKDHKPETGVTVDGESATVSFYNKDETGEIQRVTFDHSLVRKIFHGSFHKLHILVSSNSVKLKVDCQEVEEKKTKAAGNVSRDGYQVLGKMTKSIGSKGQSATFQLQMFDIVCNLAWTSRDRCCDLPSTVRVFHPAAVGWPDLCCCTWSSKPAGPGGRPGHSGPRGRPGHSGPRGRPGHSGPRGRPGHSGTQGTTRTLWTQGTTRTLGDPGDDLDTRGPRGRPGHSGTQGTTRTLGDPGDDLDTRGPRGRPGHSGTQGTTWTLGDPGDDPDTRGPRGRPGHSGTQGTTWTFGTQGTTRTLWT
uniref:Collagen, type XIV, alpha 1b n=1 Tax=Xiphophorus maculatus TaxID=8083 RepID=A0A3B5R0T8_XIPMA